MEVSKKKIIQFNNENKFTGHTSAVRVTVARSTRARKWLNIPARMCCMCNCCQRGVGWGPGTANLPLTWDKPSPATDRLLRSTSFLLSRPMLEVPERTAPFIPCTHRYLQKFLHQAGETNIKLISRECIPNAKNERLSFTARFWNVAITTS